MTRAAIRHRFVIGPRRPNRSKQGTEWARAVRRLGVLVGMGGKANCLCLRGIWETPKPRYREETKPVVEGCLGPLACRQLIARSTLRRTPTRNARLPNIFFLLTPASPR